MQARSSLCQVGDGGGDKVVLILICVLSTCHEIDVALTPDGLCPLSALLYPGYGLAVANAQHTAAALSTMLKSNGTQAASAVEGSSEMHRKNSMPALREHRGLKACAVIGCQRNTGCSVCLAGVSVEWGVHPVAGRMPGQLVRATNKTTSIVLLGCTASLPLLPTCLWHGHVYDLWISKLSACCVACCRPLLTIRCYVCLCPMTTERPSVRGWCAL